MQIKIDLKIFIFIIIFIITRQIEIYGMLMLFAFLHELGHLFAGILLGFKPQSLKLNALGLSVNFKVNTKDYNSKLKNGNILAVKKLVIAISGPLVNFLLVFLFFLFNGKIFGIEKNILIYSNLLIGLFNLIPIYPLDGGRIVKNILHISSGLEDTYSYMSLISFVSIVFLTVFSSIMIIYLKNIAILLIIGYLWYLVISENKIYNQKVKIYEIIEKLN